MILIIKYLVGSDLFGSLVFGYVSELSSSNFKYVWKINISSCAGEISFIHGYLMWDGVNDVLLTAITQTNSATHYFIVTSNRIHVTKVS